MALPTSGTLTLNQIHIEAAGNSVSGTACTLNDTDIRGLTPAAGKTINTGSGTAIEIGDFYGAQSEYPINIPTAASNRIITKAAGENLSGYGGADFYGYSGAAGASISNPNGGLNFGTNISFYNFSANSGGSDGIGSYEGGGLNIMFRTNDNSKITLDPNQMNFSRIDVNRTASADPSYGSYGPARSYYLSQATIQNYIVDSICYIYWGNAYGQAMGKTGGGLYGNAYSVPTHTLTFV